LVQFAAWTLSFTIATNPNNINVFPSIRWQSGLTSDEGEAGYVWPFDATDWKGFKIIFWRQNDLGNVQMTRRLNGVDVGQVVTLNSPPPEPPAVPTIFTDVTVSVPINKGDVLSYRWKDTNRGQDDIFATFWSYFEFPDGLWGF